MGTVTQYGNSFAGPVVTVPTLYVGYGSGSTGSYWINSGTLSYAAYGSTATAGSFYVGYNGTGASP